MVRHSSLGNCARLSNCARNKASPAGTYVKGPTSYVEGTGRAAAEETKHKVADLPEALASGRDWRG
jgi:hypothetical protein